VRNKLEQILIQQWEVSIGIAMVLEIGLVVEYGLGQGFQSEGCTASGENAPLGPTEPTFRAKSQRAAIGESAASMVVSVWSLLEYCRVQLGGGGSGRGGTVIWRLH
jgi:hypothetical protein